jgi:UDP-3-O-[3-hydroxymyristoyl] glucosamine N-acyltransferase
MKAQNKISIDELLDALGDSSKVLGARDRYLSAISPIDEAKSEAVTFCNKPGPAGLQKVRSSRAGVVICYEDLKFTEGDFKDKTLILVPNPRLAFMRVVRKFFSQGKKQASISPSATVDEGAKIHPSVYIGPNCYIGKCEIGENTVIDGNVYIYPGAVIGKNVIIQANTVIGAEGMGYERNARGDLEKFPQIGGIIVIEDDVEIGSNVSIIRGAMGNTVIGQGTKVGNLCNIGHRVKIGKHCLIVTGSVLGGGSRLGDYSQVALCACIRNGVSIGRNVEVGMGAVVTKDVGDGKLVYGVPAVERGDAPHTNY